MNNIPVRANEALNIQTNADNSQLKEKVERLSNAGNGVSFQVTKSRRFKRRLLRKHRNRTARKIRK